MADSLEDAQGCGVFNFSPDWIVEPTHKQEIQASDNIYPGTVRNLYFNRFPARKLKMQIFDDQTRLYSFLLFFCDVQGRYKKFWMPDLFARFNALSIQRPGEANHSIRIAKLPNLYAHGLERVFILLNNGDRIMRRIVEILQEAEYTEFTFVTPLPENFEVADIQLCTLAFLGRLEQDAIDIVYITDEAASVDIEFVELLHEYSASDA